MLAVLTLLHFDEVQSIVVGDGGRQKVNQEQIK